MERQAAVKRFTNEPDLHPAVRARKELAMREILRHPGSSLEELLPVLHDCTLEVRNAATKGLEDAISWLSMVNDTRWTSAKNPTPLSGRESNLDNIKSTLAKFRTSKQFLLLDAFKTAFDDNGDMKPDFRARLRYSTQDIFRCNVFTTSLIGFILEEIDFLEYLLSIERKCSKAKFQFPAAFTKMLVRNANSTHGPGNPLDLGAKINGMDEGSHTPSNASIAGDEEKEGATNKKEKAPKAAKTYREGLFNYDSVVLMTGTDRRCSQGSRLLASK
jgi:hypothetical protein